MVNKAGCRRREVENIWITAKLLHFFLSFSRSASWFWTRANFFCFLFFKYSFCFKRAAFLKGGHKIQEFLYVFIPISYYVVLPVARSECMDLVRKSRLWPPKLLYSGGHDLLSLTESVHSDISSNPTFLLGIPSVYSASWNCRRRQQKLERSSFLKKLRRWRQSPQAWLMIHALHLRVNTP